MDIILGTGTGSAFHTRQEQQTLTFVRVTYGTDCLVKEVQQTLTCVRVTYGTECLVREVQPTLSFLRVTFGTADPDFRQGDEAVAPPPQKGYSSMTQRMYEQVLEP